MTDSPKSKVDGLFWAILTVAMLMRLIGLDGVPPGLSADEASNAYDAYCLLETGQDRWEAKWPIVLRAFGDADYRPALHAYLIVPFLWLLGPANIVVAARLPAALCGVLTVVCLYAFMRRVFGRPAALTAAGLLAVSPWHVLFSHLAHESALTPLFAPLVLWLLERGGFPFRSEECRWRAGFMVAAGAAAGISLYSYASMRLFMPAMLVGLALLYGRRIGRSLWMRDQPSAPSSAHRQGWWPLSCFVVAGIVVAGPMLYVTLTQLDRVNARAQTESLLHREPTLTQALALTARQYVDHFGPGWLFISGHPYVDQSVRGFGQLALPMVVLLPLGLAAMIIQRKQNSAFAAMWLLLLIYPIASATTKGGVNAARAACGLTIFPMIAGIGLAVLLDVSIAGRGQIAGRSVAGTIGTVIAVAGGWFAYHFFAVWPKNAEVHARYQAEFRTAMDYLRPRQDLFDQVFITDRRSMQQLWHSSEAYIYPLAYLPIPPGEFHQSTKIEINPASTVGFHRIERFGRFTCSINRQALGQFAEAMPAGKILLIARPGEVAGGRRVLTISRPAGPSEQPALPALELITVDFNQKRMPILLLGD